MDLNLQVGFVHGITNTIRRQESWDQSPLNKTFHAEEFNFIKENSKREIKVPVTGAYTLADWSYDEHYKSKDDLVLALARNVVRPLVKDLVGLGAKIIQIDEPAATTHPAEMDIFRESINESVKGIDAKFVVHACFLVMITRR